MLNFALSLEKASAYFEKKQGKYFFRMGDIVQFYSRTIRCLYPPA